AVSADAAGVRSAAASTSCTRSLTPAPPARPAPTPVAHPSRLLPFQGVEPPISRTRCDARRPVGRMWPIRMPDSLRWVAQLLEMGGRTGGRDGRSRTHPQFGVGGDEHTA